MRQLFYKLGLQTGLIRKCSSTGVIGWRFFNERVDPDGRGDKSLISKDMIDSFGQLADDRPYEDHQRVPGDYDAMTSQRPIAVHKLENL